MGEAVVQIIPSLKKISFKTFISGVVLTATNPTKVEFVRDCIETMGKKFREKCIYSQESYTPADACRVLNCVLDNSFRELSIKIRVSGDLFQSFSNLIFIIARRAPKLEKLKIYIVNTSGTTSLVTADSLEPIFSNGSRLLSLKKLVLRNDDSHQPSLTLMDASHRSVLSVVGEYCPALTELVVKRFTLAKKDLVGLILGTLVDIVLPTGEEKWSEDPVLRNLRISHEFATPLCSTLLSLSLENCLVPFIDGSSTLAFILRHLQKLKGPLYMLQNASVLKAIKILHDNDRVDEDMQQEFGAVCREAASHISFERISTSAPISPCGFLSFHSLDCNVFEDFHCLRAVKFLCPHIKLLFFSGYSLPQSLVRSKSELVAKEIDFVLSGWKLNYIHLSGFHNSSGPIVRSILSAVAPSLKMLTFLNCQQIEMAHLAATCTELEYLCFSSLTSLHLEADDPSSCWTSDTFFPSLKTFRSHTCLGIWSSLFEGKSELENLQLNCCHIGTDANSTHLEWSKMPKVWQRLESLELGRCTDLSMIAISELIPQMDSLRRVEMPESIMLKDPQITLKVTQDLSKRKIPIQLISLTSGTCEPCPHQHI